MELVLHFCLNWTCSMDGWLRLHTQRCTSKERGLRKDSCIRWDGAEQEKLRNEYVCMPKKKKNVIIRKSAALKNHSASIWERGCNKNWGEVLGPRASQ